MANIFNRVSDILHASIHDMLDRVENPEQMLKQMVREMEQSVSDAKERVIDAVASEKHLKKQLEQLQEAAQPAALGGAQLGNVSKRLRAFQAKGAKVWADQTTTEQAGVQVEKAF